MLRSIGLSLRTWRPGGEVSQEEYFSYIPVQRLQESLAGFNQKQRTVCLTFFELERSAFQGADTSKQFWNAVRDGWMSAATVLQSLSPERIAAFRAAGVTIDIIVVAQIDGDQIDFEVPPEVLFEMGRLKLPFSVISND